MFSVRNPGKSFNGCAVPKVHHRVVDRYVHHELLNRDALIHYAADVVSLAASCYVGLLGCVVNVDVIERSMVREFHVTDDAIPIDVF